MRNTAMETNVKMSAEEQAFQSRAIEGTILEAAMEKWREENEFGGDVDTESRTVTVSVCGGDFAATYRYGFDEYGGLHLWNEEDGEEAPEELAD